MNLTRIISIKERIAISSEWKPDERDFILECINMAISGAKAPPSPEVVKHAEDLARGAYLTPDERNELFQFVRRAAKP